jgi:hypothetical protein
MVEIKYNVLLSTEEGREVSKIGKAVDRRTEWVMYILQIGNRRENSLGDIQQFLGGIFTMYMCFELPGM